MNQVRMPDPGMYHAMGQDNIIRMVEAVYENLGRSPIAHMFPGSPDGLRAAAQKSALFWITACGGPALYEQKFGHPRMRMRHMGFAITPKARDQWLEAWWPVLDRASTDFGCPSHFIQGFKDYLEDFSTWMINTEEPSP